MSAESGWIDEIVKGLMAAFLGVFGWVWRMSHRQTLVDERVRSMDRRIKRTEAGVGRILNHLTGTNLHDIDVDGE